MDTLRAIVARWRTMPIGQRAALTAVPVVAVVAIALSFGLGGQSSMTLLDGGRTFTNDELRQMQSAFRLAGLTGFRVEGQRICVPERNAIRFTEVAASTRGSADGNGSELDKVLSQTNIFATGREKSEQLERARARELEKIIRGIPGIDDATVLWDRAGVRTSLVGDNKLKATVSVRPKPGVDLTAAVADSLRMTVAGAVADLRPDQVIVLNVATGKVIPFGTPASASNDSGATGGPDGVGSLFHAAAVPRSAVDYQSGRHEKDSRPPRHDGSSDRLASHASVKTDLAPFSLSPITASLLLIGIATLAFAVLGRAWRKPAPPLVETSSSPGIRPTARSETKTANEGINLSRESDSSSEIDHDDNAAVVGDEISSPATSDDEAPAAPRPNRFGFLDHVDPARLTSAVGDEHPQTIALVLSHMPPETAEAVLDSLPNGTRWQVERRMAHAQPASSEIVHEVARALERRLSDRPGATRGIPAATGGSSASAESDDLGWGDLQDIARLTRPQLRKLVTHVPRSQLVLALKAAAPDVKARVLECFGPRQANLLWEEINQLGPLRVRDLDAARQAIAAESRRLFGHASDNAASHAHDPAADSVRRRIENLSADSAPAETTKTD